MGKGESGLAFVHSSILHVMLENPTPYQVGKGVTVRMSHLYSMRNLSPVHDSKIILTVFTGPDVRWNTCE